MTRLPPWTLIVTLVRCPPATGMTRLLQLPLEPPSNHETETAVASVTPQTPEVPFIGAKQIKGIIECLTISKESFEHTLLHSRE